MFGNGTWCIIIKNVVLEILQYFTSSIELEVPKINLEILIHELTAPK